MFPFISVKRRSNKEWYKIQLYYIKVQKCFLSFSNNQMNTFTVYENWRHITSVLKVRYTLTSLFSWHWNGVWQHTVPRSWRLSHNFAEICVDNLWKYEYGSDLDIFPASTKFPSSTLIWNWRSSCVGKSSPWVDIFWALPCYNVVFMTQRSSGQGYEYWWRS
jgi:hypothetical protein